MEIRKATIGDLEGICRVASSVRIDYEHPQEKGFLVYALDVMKKVTKTELKGLIIFILLLKMKK